MNLKCYSRFVYRHVSFKVFRILHKIAYDQHWCTSYMLWLQFVLFALEAKELVSYVDDIKVEPVKDKKPCE